MRECNTCSLNKPLEEFPKNSKGKLGRGRKCLSCSAKTTANYRKKRPFHSRALKFKTTEAEIEKVLSIHFCMICGREPSWRQHSIDHDHQTGKIRGLLCDTCNKGLGQFLDNPVLLRKAADYLEKCS